jgi:hypothetical protein
MLKQGIHEVKEIIACEGVYRTLDNFDFETTREAVAFNWR